MLANRDNIYTTKKDIIKFPRESTSIDFVYKIHTDMGNTMVGSFVNDELSYGPREDWIGKAHTSLAKRKIKEFNKK